MRKRSYLLLLSSAALLASCGTLSIVVNSELIDSSLSMPNEVHNEVVRLDLRAVSLPPLVQDAEPLPIESLGSSTIATYCFDTLNDGIYVSLADFGSLIKPHLKEGLDVGTGIEGGVGFIRVYEDEEIRYALTIDPKEELLTHQYDGEPLYEEPSKEEDPFLRKQTHILRKDVYGEQRSFADAGIRHFEADGAERYDLTFLEGETRQYLDCHFAPDAHDGYLFSYRDIGALNQTFVVKGKNYVPLQMLQSGYAQTYRNGEGKWLLPMVMRQQQRALYHYFLGQEEGLWDYRGVQNPNAYLSSVAGQELTLDEDDALRAEGYARLTASFDDVNASILPSPWYAAPTDDPSQYYSLTSSMYLRQSAKTRLQGLRKGYVSNPSSVRFGLGNKIAMFCLDSLENKDYDILKQNLAALSQVQATTDVVIDLSLCGSGSEDVLYKALALISPNNDMRLYELNDDTGGICYKSAKVDVNQDGAFDENETFGTRFRIHLLQSDYTASYANLLCAYAAKLGYADLLGDAGCGGECAIGSFRLPLGQSVRFSSKIRHVWMNEQGLPIPVQRGLAPSVSWGYEKTSYDLEVLGQRLGLTPTEPGQ